MTADGDMESQVVHLRTGASDLFPGDEILTEIDTAILKLLDRLEVFEGQGSGWTLQNVEKLDLDIARFNPIGGSSFIPSPDCIKNTHCCLNIQNEDELCFLYCVAASALKIDYKKQPHRTHHYLNAIKDFNIDGLTFPLPPNQIPKFEKQNQDYSVNVFYLDEETNTIMPMKLTKERERKYHVDLLLLSEEDKRHYILIRNLSGLYNDKSKHDGKCFPCRYCFQRLSTAERLERHIRDYKKHSPQVILYPIPAIMGKHMGESESEIDDFEQQFLDETTVQSSERHANLNDCNLNRPYTYTREEDYDIKQDRSKLCFKSLNKTHSVPFCFYLDFESYLVKSVDKYDREIHIPSGFCCLRVSRYSRYNDEKAYLYSGLNVMQHFNEHLHNELEKIDKILEKQLPITIDPETQAKFERAKTCYTCGVKFDKKENIACRHHDHVTSEYLAAVCRNYNLQLKPSKLRNDMNK